MTIEYIFWIFLAVLIFVYAGYPAIMLILSTFIRIKHQIDDGEPTVSLIVSAYNEEKIIAKKLKNSLELDYPKEKLEIIVASDGSSDQTDTIAESFADRGIKLFRYSRMGKTGIQNESVKNANGDIIVFSDSNAMYRKDALRKLVRHFGDDRIGCVCGQLAYKNSQDKNHAFGETIYWIYEKKLKIMESRLSSLVGANGSIYAVRKSDYIFIDNQLISDFVEPLELVKKGKRVIYEPDAISEETVSENYGIEFDRKIRILVRSIQGLVHMRALLNPFKYGMFAFQFISHKLLRYLVPFILIVDITALIFLSHIGPYFVLYLCLIYFLLLALIGKFTERNAKKNLLCNLAYYYALMNLAIVRAWIRVLRGEKIVIWKPER